MRPEISCGLFLSTFALVFVAELPGKTTFASLLMAARTGPLPVFLGACGAFILHGAIAVTAGSLLGLLPARPVETAVGLVFLALAWLLWREDPSGFKDDGRGSATPFAKTAAASFGVIFAAQWGDPSQLATAALAAKSRAPWTIFFAATSALWAVTALAVAAGKFSRKKMRPRAIQRVAAVIFAGIGLFLLAQACQRVVGP